MIHRLTGSLTGERIMFEKNFRKHIWMLQTRESKASIAEKVEDGREDLIDTEWTDSLKKPVSGARALWIEQRVENKYTQTRIIRVA